MHLLSASFAVLYAVFLWWFTTGLIIVVYDRSRVLTSLAFVGASLALLVSVIGLVLTRHDNTLLNMYLALTCGIVIWGWQVAGYYLGFVTGPSIKGYTELAEQIEDSPIKRFWLALYAGLHHELMALGFALLIAFLTWDSPNKWGLWVYLTLWLMHTSAKLNVFFGVRNFHIEFLPSHLHHLGKLFNVGRHNWFFPASIALSTSVVLVLVYNGVVPSTVPTQSAGLLSVATLMGLGVLEHWLLVLPIPSTLWGWGMRSLPQQQKPVTIKAPLLPAKQPVANTKGQSR